MARLTWYDLTVPKWLHPWLGTPDGVGAIATAAASIIALVGLIYLAVQQRDIRREQRRLEADRAETEREARRQQASRVGCWVAPGTTFDEVAAVVANRSDLPIYDVTAVVLQRSGGVLTALDAVRHEHPIVMPLEEVRLDVDDPKTTHGSPGESFAVVAAFVDSGGRCWYRDERGRLHEGPYECPPGTPLVPWS